jgi:hypothetical protein
MSQRLTKCLTEELLAWRQTLDSMRGTNPIEVDAVIGHIDASIRSVGAPREAEEIDHLLR